MHVPVALPETPRSTRPASATRSAPASWPAGRWGWACERSAQLGSLLATLVLETDGTAGVRAGPAEFAGRLGEVYGEDAAAEIAAAFLPDRSPPRRSRCRCASARARRRGRSRGATG